jgi:hypothetical protein
MHLPRHGNDASLGVTLLLQNKIIPVTGAGGGLGAERAVRSLAGAARIGIA